MIGVTFEVADLSDLATRTDITDQLDRYSYRKPLNEEGSGRLVVPYGETISPSPLDKVVIASHNGVEAFSMLVSTRTEVQVDPGGEFDMTTSYLGDGLAVVGKRMRVRPVLGFGREPFARRRAYTCFSLEYDPSAWGAATEYIPVGDPGPHWGGFSGFPDYSVPRIGPPEGDETGAPTGYWYWQDEFTLTDGIGLVYYKLVDNSSDDYFQGFQLGRIKLDGEVSSFTVAHRYVFPYVSPGTIRVGGRVVNVPLGGGDPGPGEGTFIPTNPTFMAGAIYELNGDGSLGDELWRTSSACKLLSYPTAPPGMTDLEVIQAIVDDNPNAVPQVTVVGHGTFEPRESITVRVGGDNLVQHLRNRADGSWIDWTMPPAALEYHIWPAGERGTASGVAYVDADGSLQGLEATDLVGGPDCVHVAYQGGDVLVGGEGERMAYLETDALTIREAIERGEAALATPDPTSYQVDVLPVTGKVPGVDVEDGDTLSAGALTGLRLQQWSADWPDENGEPAFRIEVGDRIREKAERQALILARSSPGHMGGNQPGNPAPDSPFTSEPAPFQSLKWNVEKPDGADYTTGEAPLDDIAAVSGTLCAVRITAKALASGTASVAVNIDGVDSLAGAGDLPSSEPTLTVVIPTDQRYWITAGVTRITIDITSVGTGLEGLVVDLLLAPPAMGGF